MIKKQPLYIKILVPNKYKNGLKGHNYYWDTVGHDGSEQNLLFFADENAFKNTFSTYFTLDAFFHYGYLLIPIKTYFKPNINTDLLTLIRSV